MKSNSIKRLYERYVELYGDPDLSQRPPGQ
jgi:hypothetical protein